MNILVVSVQSLFRAGLCSLLERAGHAAAEATDGAEGLERARAARPDLVLVDGRLADLDPLDLVRALRADRPDARVLVVCALDGAALLAAGAAGCLLESATAEELALALHTVLEGGLYVSPALTGVAPEARESEPPVPESFSYDPPSSEAARLTLREREVIKRLAEGASSKDIAQELTIALPTVETHRRRIMSKLALHNVAELTRWAIRAGISSLEP